MFLVNGIKATLRQYNRSDNESVFDDTNYKEIKIKCCSYNADTKINFDIYSTREATGFYQVPRRVDVRVGDQIRLEGKYSDGEFHTIMNVRDEWIFNRVENKIIEVK